MITALCRSDPTSRLIDQMLLGVTLITQITQSQPRLWNGGEDDKKAERMIAGNLDRGGTPLRQLMDGGKLCRNSSSLLC